MATTQEALRTEERILTSVEEGKGTANPIIAADTAPVRLQEASDRPLNPGQLAAASLILSSADRTVSVQGVAGAGKSTMLQAVAGWRQRKAGRSPVSLSRTRWSRIWPKERGSRCRQIGRA